MMLGATLGGNATLIGASVDVVAAGICAGHGKLVTFGRFLCYGLPIAGLPLAVLAVYALALFFLMN